MGPVFLACENSIEKLKILDYERLYCQKNDKPPFNRVYFAMKLNPVDQFYDFAAICHWLFTLIDKTQDRFHYEEDDGAGTIINQLLLALRQIEFKSAFPTQRLQAGSGEEVCQVLDFLTDKALQTKGFKWAAPVYSREDENVMGDDDELDEDDNEDIAVSITIALKCYYI